MIPVTLKELRASIRDVPDFPKPGIVFKDITTMIRDARYFHAAVEYLCQQVAQDDFHYIAGIEARGFIFASAMAYKLGKGLILIRKPGKLPARSVVEQYELEYGTDQVEMHADALNRDDRVVLIDDLLATGGTALASCRLIEQLEARVVKIGFVVELAFLPGRELLSDYAPFSLISFQSE